MAYKQPLVSIIIPTYMRPDTLERAIKSAANQSYKKFEIIVVDDNNPNTEERILVEKVMNKYKGINEVKYFKHKKNGNGAVARNTGIKNANGEYIAFLDDDDEFLYEKIELQVNKICSLGDEWGGVYCGATYFNKGKIIDSTKIYKEGNLKDDLLLMNFALAGGSTLLFRKEVLIELGGFDESFSRHQDWEIMIRFFRKYKLAVVQKNLVNIYTDSEINRPNPFKLEDIKHKYLDTFKDDINMCLTEVRSEIYKRQWFEVSKAYIKRRNYKKGWDMYIKSKKYKKTTFKDKAIILLCLLDGLIPDFLERKIKRVYRTIKNK